MPKASFAQKFRPDKGGDPAAAQGRGAGGQGGKGGDGKGDDQAAPYVKQVCCGSVNTLALTSSGEVYVLGDNSFG